MVILIPLLGVCLLSEQAGNVSFQQMNVDQSAGALQSGGNMEGKEVRFGIANSALWAVATTAASNGSVNAMHDSFTPLGGLAPLWLMQLGEIIFGGVGSGLYGMLMFVLITVFVAGLMVGRTPEYLGKKIEAFEIKMASLVILIPAAIVLIGTAVAVVTKPGLAGIFNPGPHGFSEILYAFSSAANNNGSAFAGLNANTLFYNTTLGCAMLIGRFWLMIPVLAAAGIAGAQEACPRRCRHAAHAHAAVCAVPGGGDHPGGRADVHPCPGAGTDCRTSGLDSIMGRDHERKDKILFAS